MRVDQVAIGHGEGGVLLHGPAIGGDGLGDQPLVLEGVAQVVPGVGGAGFLLEGPPKQATASSNWPWSFKALPRLVSAAASSGLAQGLAVTADGVGELSAIGEGGSQVVVGQDVVAA